MSTRMMVCNIGWCKEYQGDRVHGNHRFIRRTKGDGSERWNFKRYRDGKVRGYFRGIGKTHALPNLPDNARGRWIIVFYASDPADRLLKVVGYYRSASILPEWEERPEQVKVRTLNENHCYCVVVPAKLTKLFAEGSRPLFGRTLGQVGFVYLTDPETGRVKRNRRALYKRLSTLVSGRFVTPKSGSHSINQRSPITVDPQHRKAVEKASMAFVKKQLRRERYNVENVSHKNLGYDLKASRGADILYIEVKGTGGTELRFIITSNEVGFMEKDPSSRVAIVTSALSQPKLHVIKGFDIEKAFMLSALQFEARPRSNTSHITTGVTRYFVLAS